MFAMSRARECYRHYQIAEIGRAYLRNIARHYGRPYGLKTWQQIGDSLVSREIYAREPIPGGAVLLAAAIKLTAGIE